MLLLFYLAWLLENDNQGFDLKRIWHEVKKQKKNGMIVSGQFMKMTFVVLNQISKWMYIKTQIQRTEEWRWINWTTLATQNWISWNDHYYIICQTTNDRWLCVNFKACDSHFPFFWITKMKNDLTTHGACMASTTPWLDISPNPLIFLFPNWIHIRRILSCFSNYFHYTARFCRFFISFLLTFQQYYMSCNFKSS